MTVGQLKLELEVSDFVIQDFLSHGISIPIGSLPKKLVKILCQLWIDQCHMRMVDHI